MSHISSWGRIRLAATAGHVKLNLLESCGCFKWLLMICKPPRLIPQVRGSLSNVMTLWLCLCWGNGETWLGGEFKKESGLQPCPAKASYRKYCFIQKAGQDERQSDIKASSVQCTLFSNDYWISSNLMNTVFTTLPPHLYCGNVIAVPFVFTQ